MVHLRGLFFFSESSLSITGVDFDTRCSRSALPPAAALSAPGVAIMLHGVSVFDRGSLSAVGSSSCSSAHPSPSQWKPFSSIIFYQKILHRLLSRKITVNIYKCIVCISYCHSHLHRKCLRRCVYNTSTVTRITKESSSPVN